MSGWSGWSGWSGSSGASGWSGWSGWSGNSGWNASPGGGSSPLVVDALTKSRGGIVLTDDVHAQIDPHPDSPQKSGSGQSTWPLMGDTKSMRRWDPAARQAAGLFDLLSGVDFTSYAASKGALDRSVLLLRSPATPLVTMARPDKAFFESQLPIVACWAELREDRASEILTQMTPQLPFWGSVVNLSPSRTPKTLEIIDMALAFACTVVLRFKQAMACPRPADYSALIQPIVPTPGHSAYPSGHSTEAHMIAFVLPKLITSDPKEQAHYAEQLERLAARIAINRTVAGLHFPADSHAGRVMAKSLAEYFLYMCSAVAASDVNARTIDPNDAKVDFDPAFGAPTVGGVAIAGLPGIPKSTSPMSWIWEQAAKEWEK